MLDKVVGRKNLSAGGKGAKSTSPAMIERSMIEGLGEKRPLENWEFGFMMY